MDCNCNKPCVTCGKGKSCPSPCGCAEPVFSVEAMPDDPSTLRFNINGKSVWYDFEAVVKDSETCTSLNMNVTDRTLVYHGECADQSIHARELGSILHLGDLGDVAADTIGDNGILNYRRETDCGEGCEGIDNGWVSTNPVEVARDSMSYILGADADGKMVSLMPPTDTSKFQYLAWAAQNKVKWVTPGEITSVSSNYSPLYIDNTTGAIVVLKGNN